MSLLVSLDTANKIGRLAGNQKVTEMLLRDETVWAGINWMQSLLGELDCVRYLFLLESPVNSLPQERVNAFIAVYNKR